MTDDLVPFARSAMDGYAVRARDVLVGNAARANALVLVPPGVRTYGVGELVEVVLVAPVESSRGACGAWHGRLTGAVAALR